MGKNNWDHLEGNGPRLIQFELIIFLYHVVNFLLYHVVNQLGADILYPYIIWVSSSNVSLRDIWKIIVQ